MTKHPITWTFGDIFCDLSLNRILLLKMSSSVQVRMRIYPATVNKGARIWPQ